MEQTFTSTEVWCTSLHKLTAADKHLVGSKASRLGELHQGGASVPPGFCIVATAYSQHIIANSIDIDFIKVDIADREVLRDHLLSLRAAIHEASIPDVVQQAIVTAYPGGTVVVRSSATAEDLPEASFAGQYDTVLNVNSLTDCLAAVTSCWASLWTERAYHYREQNHIDHEHVRMAVIVQEQVDADMAGVAFSMDPVTGSRLRVVIEACEGLGDALVSGQVTPERWIFDKRKMICLIRKPWEGAKLPPRVAKELARQVRRLEQHFTCPQDVEWALARGKLHFLQTRPITALPAPKSWDDKQVWTNLNLGEVVPDVCTPLTYSMFEKVTPHLFGSICDLLAADIRRAPVMGLVAGHLYFNLTAFNSVGRPFWVALGCNPRADTELARAMGGHQGDLDITEDDLSDMGFSWLKFLAMIPRNLWRLWCHRPARASLFLASYEERCQSLKRIEPSTLTTETLVQTIGDALRNDTRHWNLLFLITRGICMPVLDWASSRWLGETDMSLLHRLFGAQGGIADTEAGLDLWRLAVLAHEQPETEQAILSDLSWDTIVSNLDDRFVHAWQAFMNEHGHHCRGELEFSNARWYEQPDYILQMVRAYLSSLDQTDPLVRYDQVSAQSARLADDCRRRLRNPLKRRIFNWALGQARQLTRERENWKNQAVVWVAALRKLLLELGERLQSKGTLGQKEDIFFITLDELEPVTQGHADFDVGTRISSRREEYRWNSAQNPAPVVVGAYDPDKHTARIMTEDLTELSGTGSSPGRVTGPARVILHTDHRQTVAPGEILVTSFTDPSWTPYFVPAAGVVMDLGGVLSHGSIIAREYGLPAVVNVGCATQVIKTGQMIEVDGTRGLVRILAEPEP